MEKNTEKLLGKAIEDAFCGGYTRGWADALQMAEDLLGRIAKQQKYANVNRYSKKQNKRYNRKYIVCDYWEKDGLNDDDFCSYGERSEASICDNCDKRSDIGCSWCKKMEIE